VSSGIWWEFWWEIRGRFNEKTGVWWCHRDFPWMI
jgi:hypothetical protein